ncbi:polysaccharide pyruvyl transferase family protein [Hydrogenophaga sp.]|uniref:polysaccharide pyruvyl transferase family protein n=1 Tax=Hydrogenophaga sp. TaxID=1904254 RepID=UPI00273104C4|nr:polysaccharide pyruvyl transferase family protein [Hydrogenophaga sp.]MDP2017087.1 polysaccharide pyruvyl transferase family protein [Hydrogenophaga sp.]MDP3164663.1 polysaccharide pyruvyl transferase family protein [Hydrogenophaga sp.]
MNVGILTFHFSDNYGAALQAYALRRWMTEQGHHASFIDYRPAHIEHGGSLSLPTSPARLKANLKVVYLAVSSFINEHFGNKSQKEKFVRFREQFLDVRRDAAPTDNGASLAAAQSFDLIVAGSDQIWSPSQHFGFDPNYFLAFAKRFQARKISYAASFGRDRVSSSEAAQLPQLLRNFDAISVREASGITLVERATGHRPANVPDPTLLHSDYAELTERAPPEHDDPYIFCYGLRSPDNIRQTADLASKQLNCPILSPHNPHRRWVEIGDTVYPDPGEWVSLIRNARFVVTNSFHGTVFSLLFKKPFIVAGLTGEKAAANARAINLLRAVGLESRFAPSFSAQNTQALMAREIDWADVDQRLADLRQAGNAFLSTQLKAVAP